MIFQLWSRFISCNDDFRLSFLSKTKVLNHTEFHWNITYTEIFTTKTNIINPSCFPTEIRRKIQRKMCHTGEMRWTKTYISSKIRRRINSFTWLDKLMYPMDHRSMKFLDQLFPVHYQILVQVNYSIYWYIKNSLPTLWK